MNQAELVGILCKCVLVILGKALEALSPSLTSLQDSVSNEDPRAWVDDRGEWVGVGKPLLSKYSLNILALECKSLPSSEGIESCVSDYPRAVGPETMGD